MIPVGLCLTQICRQFFFAQSSSQTEEDYAQRNSMHDKLGVCRIEGRNKTQQPSILYIVFMREGRFSIYTGIHGDSDALMPEWFRQAPLTSTLAPGLKFSRLNLRTEISNVLETVAKRKKYGNMWRFKAQTAGLKWGMGSRGMILVDGT